MRRFIRYRQPKSTESAEAIEVWPVFVDVLAAALVFLLLAFFAILSRDVVAAKQRGDRDGRVAACNREHARVEGDHRRKMAGWEQYVQQLMSETTTTCAETLEKSVPWTEPLKHLRDARREKGVAEARHLEPFATSADESDSDGFKRGIVQYKYAFDGSGDISFRPGCAEPTFRVADLDTALARVVNAAALHSCTRLPEVAATEWCVIGFEVAGHADCVRLGAGSGLCGAHESQARDEWELSTNRAGHVIRRIIAADFQADDRFEIRAAGYEKRVPVNNACDCAGYGGQENHDCLDANRRVEFRIKMKTPALPVKPAKQALPDCEGLK